MNWSLRTIFNATFIKIQKFSFTKMHLQIFACEMATILFRGDEIMSCYWGAENSMMTSSNGNIFRVTGHFCGEFPSQRPVTRHFDVFFDLRLNKRLSKQSLGWWYETLSRPLWRHRKAPIKIKNHLLNWGITMWKGVDWEVLTQWSLENVVVISKVPYLIRCYWLSSWAFSVKLLPGECHKATW